MSIDIELAGAFENNLTQTLSGVQTGTVAVQAPRAHESQPHHSQGSLFTTSIVLFFFSLHGHITAVERVVQTEAFLLRTWHQVQCFFVFVNEKASFKPSSHRENLTLTRLSDKPDQFRFILEVYKCNGATNQYDGVSTPATPRRRRFPRARGVWKPCGVPATRACQL